MLSRDEKINIIKEMSSAELLSQYNYFRDKFNPLDDDFIESFNLLKDEILKRLSAYKEG